MSECKLLSLTASNDLREYHDHRSSGVLDARGTL